MVDHQENQEDVKKSNGPTMKSDEFEPVLGEGNQFLVKIKITKDKNSNISDTIVDVSKNNNSEKVCSICGKVFNSGKALGGHMRIHVQKDNNEDLVVSKKQNPRDQIDDLAKKKQKQFKKATINGDDIDSDRGSSMEKLTCMICGKDFPSVKSLSGHLRCHPERDWRGIHPPNSSSDQGVEDLSTSGEDNEALIDLSGSLRGWTVTARRGRRALVAAGAAAGAEEEGAESTSEFSSSVEPDPRDAMAVRQLMKLSGVDNQIVDIGIQSDSPPAKSEFPVLDLGSDSESKKRKIIDQSLEDVVLEKPVSEPGLVLGDEPINKSDGGGDDQLDNHEGTADFESPDDNSKMKNNSKKRVKKMKLCDLESSPVVAVAGSSDKHTCETCGKVFKSHQALGGHRASHNKFKLVVHDSNKSGNFNKRDTTYNRVRLGPAPQSHNCMVCNKSFATAEDLTVHQANHGSGSTSQVVSGNGSGDEEASCKVFDIDLNELPPSEDDEAGFDSQLALA